MACRRRKRPLGFSEKVLRLSWQLHSEELTIAFACAKMPTNIICIPVTELVRVGFNDIVSRAKP